MGFFADVRGPSTTTEHDEGFAAVDALTALAILAVTITLSIVALSVAGRAQRAATEANAARTTLQELLSEPVGQPGLYSGSNRLFNWTLQVGDISTNPSLVRLCAQKVSVRSKTSGKLYVASSQRQCPPQKPTP